MKAVTKPQRALCAKALRHYREYIFERQASHGDCITQDFDDAYEAEYLAYQFEKESQS
jgi:hypothetical protein